MSVRMDVDTFLNSLGTTSGEVATKLEEMGIKGRRFQPLCCPLAVVVRRELNLDTEMRAYEVRSHNSFVCHLPRACNHFMQDFDSRVYPQLIQGPDEE